LGSLLETNTLRSATLLLCNTQTIKWVFYLGRYCWR
jgi:hypothetical protein